VLGRFAVTRPLRRLVPKPQGFVSHATVIDQQTAAPTRGVGGVRPPPLGTITLAASKPRVGGCYVTPTAGSDLFPRVTDTPTGSEGRITGYGLKGGNGTVLDAVKIFLILIYLF
jgi:hypothetical protein